MHDLGLRGFKDLVYTLEALPAVFQFDWKNLTKIQSKQFNPFAIMNDGNDFTDLRLSSLPIPTRLNQLEKSF